MSFLSQASLKKAQHLAHDCLQKTFVSNNSHLLIPNNPTLYHAYIGKGQEIQNHTHLPTLQYYFEKQKLDPLLQETRITLIRLFSIAVKAHFFLFPNDFLAEEPSVFWVPDLLRTKKDRFGLYYPFLKSKKALIVAEVDLAQLSSLKLDLFKFPVILNNDTNSWLNYSHWDYLQTQVRDLQNFCKLQNKTEFELAQKITNKTQFTSLGTIFDYPEELNPYLKACGLRYASGIQSFYLPKGYDLEPVQQYIEFIYQQFSKAKKELENLPNN